MAEDAEGKPRCSKCWKKILPQRSWCASCHAMVVWSMRNRGSVSGSSSLEFPQYHWICHLGFLSVHETPEMLDRLRWKEEIEEPQGPARSKIGSTNRVIEPIDRVARRVANE